MKNDYFCRDWSKIFRGDSGAKYWSWAQLRVNLNRFPDQRVDLRGSRIIRLVPEIRIWRADHNLLRFVLESVMDGETVQLKKLTTYCGLAYIDPGLLSSAVLKLQDCNINFAQQGQQKAILAGIRDSASRSLKNLELGFLAFDDLQVAPDIVAGAAMKLERLKTRLSSPQMKAIIIRLAATEDSKLRELVVCGGPFGLSSLDPEVVAGAYVKLETVGPNLIGLPSSGQASALFSRILHSPDLRLKKLFLRGQDLSLVPPEDLVGVIQRLEVVMFRWGMMTGEQASAILTLAKENRLGKIKRIMIDNVSHMNSVSPSLLQQARFNKKLEWKNRVF